MKGLRERNFERTFLILASVILGFFFFRLYAVYQKQFEEVPSRLADGTMISLNAPGRDQQLKNLLQNGFYYEDPADVEFIRTSVASTGSSLQVPLENIGELNKDRFDVNAEDAFTKGGESFRKRVRLSRNLMGFTDEDSLRYIQEKRAPPALPAVNNIGLGDKSISGKITSANGVVAAGVLVRLQIIIPEDSLYSSITEVDSTIVVETPALRKVYVTDSAKKRQLQSFTAYARTDANGEYHFNGLPANQSYAVLPLKPAYEFGASKGISALNKNINLNFFQSPHTVRLFSTRDFNILKREKALIVRLPDEVNMWFFIIIGIFFLSFFLLHVLLSARFRQADQFILPVLMLLTGISFITLLSLQDPLRDRFLGRSTLYYFSAGMLGIFVLLLFDFKKFNRDSGLYHLFVFNSPSASKGWPWALAAVALLATTIIFGSGPEGSGVKVNLFGFQPSEIVKFLLIFFLAGFFAANEKFISEYTTWGKRSSFFLFSVIAIAAAILLFLVLGDLGPAMVICFTFIILFSFSRGDMAVAIGTVVAYVLLVWLIDNVLIATAITAALLLLYTFFIRKMMSESAWMVFIVMALFLLIDKMPLLDQIIPGPVQRLVERKSIWQDPWNNEVFGGDQIANGIWAMSSGGIQGQGIGEGFAKTIPEAHTDMILPAMGEELGWAGIISIFILFLIYFHRAIIIGRATGRSFLFYVCAGMGIATFVQFLLIAGGSIGALPLTGVSLPLMSYGGTSLIMNMLAAGFLLSASLVGGTAVQMNYISAQQDRNIMPALVSALIGVVLLSVTVSQYLFNNAKWVVQPALVADRSGSRMFSYNPRIAILMNRLGAGNLYDRSGLLLASSKPEAVQQQLVPLVKAGIDKNYLRTIQHRRLSRYYPFADQMFFWVGDMNSGLFMGSTNGYYAEYEHIAELRGFHTPAVNYKVAASRFREHRFLPRRHTEMNVVKRDYSALAPLLLAGINSKAVEEFKQRNRDVQMTVDARVQTRLQQALQRDTFRNSRISIVVMEDNTGDVIASAMYPLPPIFEEDKISLSTAEANRLPYWLTTSDLGFTHATQPGSTAKLVTALAAFNKLGMAAAQKRITVRSADIIRVKSEEPDEVGTISIQRGLVKSNNPFFIRLANEEQLQEQMGDIYLKSGMFLRGVGGYYYSGNLQDAEQQQAWKEYWRNTEFRSIRSYNPDNIRATRGRGVSGMAWGQGELIATPASIARVAGAIANHGSMMPNRYILKVSDSAVPLHTPVALAGDPQYAALLTKYMREQSAPKFNRLMMYVAGKTGTPERIVKGERINDGWYVFFAPKANGSGHIVTCIRIEQAKGSSVAVGLAGSLVIPVLTELNYIKSFEAGAQGAVLQ